MRLKKGAIIPEELGKIVIAVIVLAVMIGIIIVVFKGKGGEILSSIKNYFRLGRG